MRCINRRAGCHVAGRWKKVFGGCVCDGESVDGPQIAPFRGGRHTSLCQCVSPSTGRIGPNARYTVGSVPTAGQSATSCVACLWKSSSNRCCRLAGRRHGARCLPTQWRRESEWSNLPDPGGLGLRGKAVHGEEKPRSRKAVRSVCPLPDTHHGPTSLTSANIHGWPQVGSRRNYSGAISVRGLEGLRRWSGTARGSGTALVTDGCAKSPGWGSEGRACFKDRSSLRTLARRIRRQSSSPE